MGSLAAGLLAAAAAAAPSVDLVSYYSFSQEDNLVGATAATEAWARENGYVSVGATPTDGAIASNASSCPPGAVALRQLFSAARRDHWTLGSPESATDAAREGYTLVRAEGCSSAVNTTATPYPLATWFSSARNDSFLVCEAPSLTHKADAVHAGYKRVRIEAWCGAPPPPPPPPPPEWKLWPDASASIPGSPFEKSTDLVGFRYLDAAHSVPATGADTWYPSWSASGDLFTTWTDGGVAGVHSSSCGPCRGNNGSQVTQGQARAVGTAEAPRNISAVAVTDVKTFTCSALPYQGRYPSASLFYKGVWYYGTYSLGELSGNAQYPCKNWCVQGPFVGFRWSNDRGATWTEPRMQMALDFASYKASDNLFGELGPVCEGAIVPSRPGSPSKQTCSGLWKGKVKFGAPHVVDLGQELEHAPGGDKRAYVVGHGANKEYQPHSWMAGSQVYMARTKSEPSPEVMGDGSHWEFFAGYAANGSATWADDVDGAQALFTWENRTGVVTMSFVPALSKFIMCVSTCTGGEGNTEGPFDTYFLESDTITGPFKMITYLERFGPEAYFVNIPTAYLSGTDDGGGLLSYSANFAFHSGASPVGSGYTWDLLPYAFVKG